MFRRLMLGRHSSAELSTTDKAVLGTVLFASFAITTFLCAKLFVALVDVLFNL